MDLKEIINFLELEFPDSIDNINAAVIILYDEIKTVKETIAKKLPDIAMNNEFKKIEEYTKAIDRINIIDIEMKRIFPGLEDETSDNLSRECHYLSEDLKYTKPDCFKIGEKEYQVESWKDLFVKTCQYLYNENPELFMECIEKGFFSFFSKEEADLNRAKLIEGTGVYFDYSLSVERFCNTILFFLGKYRIPEKSYKIYIKKKHKTIEKGKRHKTRCLGHDAESKKCLESSSIYFKNKCPGAGGCQWYKER